MRRTVSLALLNLAAIALTVGLAPSAARANFITDMSGNTRAKNTVDAGIDGSFSFAVFDLRSERDKLDPYIGTFQLGETDEGDPSPALDLDANYLYLYQAVNDGTNATTINFASVKLDRVPAAAITSWGYFNGVSLQDKQGSVGDLPSGAEGQRNAMGLDGASYSLSIAPASLGVEDPDFAAVAGLRKPRNVIVSPQGVTTAFQASFASMNNAPGSYYRSMLFGFTTDLEPGLNTVAFQDGGGQAIGTVVAPIPEPATWAIMLSGLPLLLGWGIWRKRRSGK